MVLFGSRGPYRGQRFESDIPRNLGKETGVEGEEKGLGGSEGDTGDFESVISRLDNKRWRREIQEKWKRDFGKVKRPCRGSFIRSL